jgi:tRNA-2-methylthio-N6-dimethylallyladenosine synthase
MAERLKTQLLEKDMMVDMVVGPDAYRDLPRLLGVHVPYIHHRSIH